jgi:hypothetical protein
VLADLLVGMPDGPVIVDFVVSIAEDAGLVKITLVVSVVNVVFVASRPVAAD